MSLKNLLFNKENKALNIFLNTNKNGDLINLSAVYKGYPLKISFIIENGKFKFEEGRKETDCVFISERKLSFIERLSIVKEIKKMLSEANFLL